MEMELKEILEYTLKENKYNNQDIKQFVNSLVSQPTPKSIYSRSNNYKALYILAKQEKLDWFAVDQLSKLVFTHKSVFLEFDDLVYLSILKDLDISIRFLSNEDTRRICLHYVMCMSDTELIKRGTTEPIIEDQDIINYYNKGMSAGGKIVQNIRTRILSTMINTYIVDYYERYIDEMEIGTYRGYAFTLVPSLDPHNYINTLDLIEETREMIDTIKSNGNKAFTMCTN